MVRQVQSITEYGISYHLLLFITCRIFYGTHMSTDFEYLWIWSTAVYSLFHIEHIRAKVGHGDIFAQVFVVETYVELILHSLRWSRHILRYVFKLGFDTLMAVYLGDDILNGDKIILLWFDQPLFKPIRGREESIP